jgi:hypothetical protein
MSPLDAVDYALSRQRELLPSNRSDNLVNFISVTDGSAESSLMRQKITVTARMIAKTLRGVARVCKRLANHYPHHA